MFATGRRPRGKASSLRRRRSLRRAASVGDVERGQIGDHRLKIEQRFEPALRDLGLVRRVGRVPTRVFENVSLNHRRRDAIGVAGADEDCAHFILLRDRAQFGQRFVLRFWPRAIPVADRGEYFSERSRRSSASRFVEADFAQHCARFLRRFGPMCRRAKESKFFVRPSSSRRRSAFCERFSCLGECMRAYGRVSVQGSGTPVRRIARSLRRRQLSSKSLIANRRSRRRGSSSWARSSSEMLAVARFDRAKNVHRGNIGAGKSAIVHDLFDARAGWQRFARSRSARPPGRSLIIAVNRQSRPSATSPRSITRLKHVRIDIAAAKQEARHVFRRALSVFRTDRPRGESRPRLRPRLFPVRRCAKSRARSASSVTVTVAIDTRPWRSRMHSLPTCGMARPSASVGCMSNPCRFSALKAAEKLATFSASTAMIFALGRNVFTASETPASNPPPPTGTMTASRSGTCSTISRPIVPWPAMIAGSS